MTTKQKRRFQPWLPSLGLWLAASCCAADALVQLPETLVTAAPSAPLPQAAEALHAGHDMSMAAAGDSARLLRDVPGVALSGAGGVSSTPVLHGLADDRNRIKVDGMDLISACANHMNPPLSYIDPSNVESVKVYPALAPVSLGGDSIGGSIVVASRAPRFAAAGEGLLKSGEIGAYYKSNGNALGINAAATLASENLSLNYSAALAQSDNYTAAAAFKPASTATWTSGGDHAIAGKEVASSAYKAENQQLSLALRGEDRQLDLKLGVQHIPAQGFPSQHMDMTDNASTQINLGYRQRYAWGGLEARLYQEDTRHKMDFADDKLYWYADMMGVHDIAGMPMQTHGRNLGGSLKAEVAVDERNLLRMGSDVQFYRLDDWWSPVANSSMMGPATFWNIKDGQRDRFDLFAEWEAQLSPSWSSLLGARLSQVHMDADKVQGYNAMYSTDANAFNASVRDKTDRNLDLNAMLRYVAGPQLSLEGGYARKTRSPSLYERYTWSANGMAMTMNNWVNDGNGYVGDVNLKPEVAHTLSFTADMHDATRQAWGAQLTPYVSRVDDYIDAKCLTTCLPRQFNYLKLVNQDARLYGVDLAGFAALGKLAGWGEFSGRASLSYVNGKNLASGDYLYNIMPPNARLVLEQRLGRWNNSVETLLVSAKTRVSQVRNEMPTPGYALLNLRTVYDAQSYRIEFGIDNLFNKQYFLPLGGAYIGQGTTMTLNGSGAPYGIAMPGMGRSFNLALSHRF